MTFNSGRSCESERVALSTKFSDGPAIKLLVDPLTPPFWEYFSRCQRYACTDPECGYYFFMFPMSGKCKCLKKGYSIPDNVFGFATMHVFLY